MADKKSETKEKEVVAEDDLGTSALSEAMEADQGFIGQEIDPTPNEAYTVAGVTSGAPTPETDVDTYRATKDRRREVREFMAPEGTSRGREAD